MARQKMTATKTPGLYLRDDGRHVLRVTTAHPTKRRPDGTAVMVDRSQVLPEGTPAKEARRLAGLFRASSEAANARRLPTVAEYARTWTARKLASGDWRTGSTTDRNVDATVRNHILPDLAELPIDHVTHGVIQTWLDAMLATYKRSSVRQSWSTFRALLQAAALDFGYPDPTAKVRPLRYRDEGEKADLVLMGDGFAELHRVLELVRAERPEWLPLFLLGFATGARPSELLAAEVRDLDLTGAIGRWTIARHLGYESAVVAGTKTSDRARLSYIDPTTTARLRELLAGKFPAAPVAPRESSTRSSLRRIFEMLSARIGRPLTAKTFRQTHITASLISGIPSAVVQDQAGHSSAEMQRRYVRIQAPEREAAASRLSGVFAAEVGTDMGTESAKRDISGT